MLPSVSIMFERSKTVTWQPATFAYGTVLITKTRVIHSLLSLLMERINLGKNSSKRTPTHISENLQAKLHCVMHVRDRVPNVGNDLKVALIN